MALYTIWTEIEEIQWLDELPVKQTTRRPSDPLIEAFADALRSHPGQWAAWPRKKDKSPSGIISKIKSGGPTFPAGQFEVAQRRGAAYVRFVGGQDDGGALT